MSNRRRPDLSSRLKATRWPPASSTATVRGAQLVSRPFLSAVSTMVEAWASVTDICSISNDAVTNDVRERFSSGSLAARPIDRDGRDLGRPEAVTARLFVTGERALDEGQFETARTAFRQHGAQVLRSALDVERHRAGVAALEHLGDRRAAHFQHIRPARGVRQQIHDAVRIEAERAAQGQCRAERLPVDHQRHVDGEFHDLARAHRSAVLKPPAELIEDRLGALRVPGLGAHQADQLALACRAGRSADRAFDEGGALGANFFGELDLDAGAHRAHLDHELSRDVARQQTRRAVKDLVDRIRIGETGDDGLDRARERGRARRSLGAGVDERLRLAGRPIPYRHLMADLDQPGRHCGPHPAEAGNADMHELYSSSSSWPGIAVRRTAMRGHDEFYHFIRSAIFFNAASAQSWSKLPPGAPPTPMPPIGSLPAKIVTPPGVNVMLGRLPSEVVVLGFLETRSNSSLVLFSLRTGTSEAAV